MHKLPVPTALYQTHDNSSDYSDADLSVELIIFDEIDVIIAQIDYISGHEAGNTYWSVLCKLLFNCYFNHIVYEIRMPNN